MPKNSLNVSLKGADDIFSTEESRQEQQREQVQQIPIGELFPFKNHPFKVLDDESMQRTVESVEQYGVLSPLIARPRPEGGYEIISGHRRQHAAQLAGLDTLPVIVRQMDDDAAVLLMVDSNLQRENILPSERAFAYKMKLEAIERTVGRPKNVGQVVPDYFGKRSTEIVAEGTGESYKQVQRFIRLTNLVPELLDMVDEKKIAFNPAVELSYLDTNQQRDFLEAMQDTQNELHINEREAAVVRIIFDKYVHEGYGPQHIATYLNDNGYRARSGKCWHPASIRGMVRNLTYTGVLRCGDAHSELLQELQIIPAQQFEAAQRIRENRSNRAAQESEYRVPLNIHGQSLLSGNAYCGHCGAKLTLTSSRKWRKLSDGTLDDTLRVRYTCYGKLRKQTGCTGQTGYTVHILDEIIDKSVRQIFSKMRGIPKEQIITRRYEREVVERKNHLQTIQVERDKAQKDLISLKAEILACIKGESVFPKETLAEMITAQEEKLRELDALYESSYAETEKTAELMDNVSKLYEELISFSDLYDSASFEAKKMIVNQLIRRVDVYRGYQLNITFNFDLTPYIEGDDAAAC